MGDIVSYFHICYLCSNVLLIVKNIFTAFHNSAHSRETQWQCFRNLYPLRVWRGRATLSYWILIVYIPIIGVICPYIFVFDVKISLIGWGRVSQLVTFRCFLTPYSFHVVSLPRPSIHYKSSVFGGANVWIQTYLLKGNRPRNKKQKSPHQE